MKIVYVLPSNLVCGGHIIVLQHVTRLAKRGHEVSICILDQSIPANRNSFSWFPDFNCPVIHPSNFPEEVDICVATFWDTAIPVLKLPARQKIYFVQSDETRFYENLILKNCVALTYLCNFHYITEAKWLVGWLRENFGHQAVYIPNAFDPNIIHLDEPLAPKNQDKFRILVEGTIDSPFKRVKEAIEASQGLGCEIWCVSNGGRPDPAWPIDKFFYKVDFNQMRYIYSSCDILVKLSSVEGFFGPPLEMMACGGVCVVSDVSGYEEYIEHEQNALVVPNGDVSLARQSIIRLMHDKELYQKLQNNGKITAQSMQWEDSIDKLELYYQSLSEQSPSVHVKGERVETLRHLLSEYYSLSQEKPEILNYYKLSKLEATIVKALKGFKNLVPLSVRLSIKIHLKKLFQK